MNYRFLTILCLMLIAFSACKNRKNATVEDKIEDTNQEQSNVDVVVISEPDTTRNEVPFIEDLMKDEVDGDSTFLKYQRTACFGTCPVFEFTWKNNGKCEYHGINFVDDIGYYEGQIEESKKEEVLALLDKIAYFEMDEKYDALVSDLPAVITLVNTKNKKHRVYNRYHGPQELKELYSLLEQIIADVSWTAKEEQK